MRLLRRDEVRDFAGDVHRDFVTETYSHGDPMASVLRAEASVLLRRRDSLGTHILDYDRLAPESSRGPEPIRTRPAMHRQQQA